MIGTHIHMWCNCVMIDTAVCSKGIRSKRPAVREWTPSEGCKKGYTASDFKFAWCLLCLHKALASRNSMSADIFIVHAYSASQKHCERAALTHLFIRHKKSLWCAPMFQSLNFGFDIRQNMFGSCSEAACTWLQRAAALKGKQVSRITFTEVTKAAVTHALATPRFPMTINPSVPGGFMIRCDINFRDR